MTDQYTEISFNAGETLKASQLNTVVQNINIVNTQVENINNSITEINSTIAGKADKPAENENYATVTYVNNQIDAITTSTLGAAKADDLATLQDSLNLSAGGQNQFAVSDGNGNITWLEIPFAENSTY